MHILFFFFRFQNNLFFIVVVMATNNSIQSPLGPLTSCMKECSLVTSVQQKCCPVGIHELIRRHAKPEDTATSNIPFRNAVNVATYTVPQYMFRKYTGPQCLHRRDFMSCFSYCLICRFIPLNKQRNRLFVPEHGEQLKKDNKLK